MSTFQQCAPADLKENPFNMIGKGWMLVTAGKDKCNTMTASWGGMGVMWSRDVVFVVVRPQRYTKQFIDAEGRFSLSFLGEEHRKTLSYLGAVSGRDEDKIAKRGLTVAHDDGIPFFEEANTVLFCRALFHKPYEQEDFLDGGLPEEFYPEKDYHTLYIAEITKVMVKKA